MSVLRIGLGDFLRRVRTVVPMPFTMYDSIDLAQIPTDAIAVAGYVNGRWPTFAELERTHPYARRLSIAVSADADAACLDIENGDATPAQAASWVHRQRARGVKRPCLYIQVSNARALLALLAADGVPRSSVDIFTAHYTGVPHRCSPRCGYGMPTHADATQWTNRAHGRNLDASSCRPLFLRARPLTSLPLRRRV